MGNGHPSDTTEGFPSPTDDFQKLPIDFDGCSGPGIGYGDAHGSLFEHGLETVFADFQAIDDINTLNLVEQQHGKQI